MSAGNGRRAAGPVTRKKKKSDMRRWLNARDASFAADFAALLAMKRENDTDVSEAVRAIIADVRA